MTYVDCRAGGRGDSGGRRGIGGVNGDGKNTIKKNKIKNDFYILWGNTKT